MAKREAIYNTAVEEMTAFNARYEAGERTYFQMKRPRLDKDSFSAPPWVVPDRALFEHRKKVALQSLNPPLEEGAWVLELRRNLAPCKHPLCFYKVLHPQRIDDIDKVRGRSWWTSFCCSCCEEDSRSSCPTGRSHGRMCQRACLACCQESHHDEHTCSKPLTLVQQKYAGRATTHVMVTLFGQVHEVLVTHKDLRLDVLLEGASRAKEY